jgi:hypothetical protein
MATITVPTTIKPKAVEMAKGLGLERELDAILEQGCRMIKGLRSFEVDADTDSSMRPTVDICAWVDPPCEDDPSHQKWWEWRIDQFGPDVAAEFVVVIYPDTENRCEAGTS